MPTKEKVLAQKASDESEMPGREKPAQKNDNSVRYPAEVQRRHTHPGYVTRAMILSSTGISESDFRSLVTQGVIRSERLNSFGWALYPEECVDLIRRSLPEIESRRAHKAGVIAPIKIVGGAKAPSSLAYSAEEGLSVIERIEGGKSLIAICLELKMHPMIINAIAHDYQTLSGSMLVPKSVMDRINELPFEGSFPIESPQHLLATLKSAANALVHGQKCEVCKKRQRTHCMTCAKKQYAPAPPPKEATSEDELKLMAQVTK